MTPAARALLAASVAFTFGVIFGPAAHPVPTAVVVAALLVVAAGAARRRRPAAGLFLAAAFFFGGVLVVRLRLSPSETVTAQESRLSPDGVLVEGEVVEAPELGDLADALIVEVTGTSTAVGAPVIPGVARLRLRVPHGPGERRPVPCARAGERVRAWAVLRPVAPAVFPTLRSRRLAVRRGVTLNGEARSCVVIAPAPGVAALGARVRARVAAAARGEAPGPARSLVAVMATGERAGIDPALEDELLQAGLQHLLVAHNLYWLALVFLLARRHRGAALLLAGAMTLLHGADPAAVRVALTVALVLVAMRARGRWRPDAAPALEPTPPEASRQKQLLGLALAAIVVLGIVPEALGDVAFQMPFAAMAAMVRVYPALEARAPRFVRPLLAGVAVTIGITPLAARIFDRVGIGSLFAHALILPWAALVAAPLATAGGVLAALHPAVGAPVLAAATAAAEVVRALASAAAAAAVQGGLPVPTVLECLLFYVATGLFCAKGRRWYPLAGAACVALLIASAAYGVASRPTKGTLDVAVLPTTGGLTAVAQLRDGRTLAVDGNLPAAGFDLAERRVAGYLALQRRRHLDVLCVLDPARWEPARALTRQLDVGEVWWMGAPASVPPAFGRTPDRFLGGGTLLLDGGVLLASRTATAAPAAAAPAVVVIAEPGSPLATTPGAISATPERLVHVKRP